MGIGYALMALAAIVSHAQNASVLWLVGATMLLTLGELYLSPVGLSLVTKVAPARIVSLMMGMWFISSFLGNYLEGFLATYWTKMEKSTFFFMLMGLSFLASASMLAVMVPLKKALGEDRAKAGNPASEKKIAEAAVASEDEAAE
jgi:POT family proton-dependent oligopeptide transporter